MKPRYCPRIKSLLASPDFKPGYIALSRMRCKQWDCEFCAIKNADMWRAHLLQQLIHNMPDKRWVFITLTAPPWAHKDPLVSLQVLKRGWGKMYDRLRYWNGGELSYVLVFETHLSGAYHVHALVDMGEKYDAFQVSISPDLSRAARIKQEKKHPFCRHLKDLAVKSKVGFICHATRIKEGAAGEDNARLAVGYITKYFTKGAAEMQMPPRWRRLATSRDIGSPKTKSKKEFTWVVRHAITIRDVKFAPHFLIAENRDLDPSDFGDAGLYPSPDENA